MLKEGILLGLFVLGGCTSLKSNGGKDRGEYYVLRGANFKKAGDNDKALKEYEKALIKNSRSEIALKEIALIHGERGDYTRAAEYYRRVLKVNPEEQSALKNLAYIAYRDDDEKKSREYLDRISKENRDEFVLKVEGGLQFRKNNHREAYEIFGEALEKDIHYDKFFYEMVRENLEILSKGEEFKNILEKSSGKFYQNRDFVIYYSGVMGGDFNSWDKVNRTLKNYLIKNSADDEIYYLLAHSYHGMGDRARAILTLKMFSEKFRHTERYRLLEKKLLI